ncbi:DUF6671 family protein [Haloplasma contractile]|uniref:DUF6671 domain-containing protein n=1 Tax=Haloplasma contractile SSD-17B TaxID=1033810 RepID=F7Q0E9_9MOLU|nr:DUF6671 family protein [Haloplasma contractile]ERJ12705.1 hypothetical protein HLPCO_001045 [Haloplasma contractile SSD-17B]
MDVEKIIKTYFKGRSGVIATMHKKEEVMKPILEGYLDIKVTVPKEFNTDEYGTFTRDIKRRGDQQEAARFKLKGALKLTGESLGFASEGVFGPHPQAPFIPFNQELVLLYDQENNLEIVGVSSTTETNFDHKTISSYDEAYEFCKMVSFPEHAVVIKVKENSKKSKEIIKGITTEKGLTDAVEYALKKSKNGTIFIETDMRALYNPSRMKNIESATHNLIKNIYNICPDCKTPGFTVVENKKGLPCSLCGFPSRSTLSVIYRCTKCKHEKEELYPNGVKHVDPMHCSYCNP